MDKDVVIKRPWGITLIAVLLIWLSIAAFASVFAFSSHTVIQKSLNLIYGSTALITAVGLWKLKEWVTLAYKMWSISVAITAIYLQSAIYSTSIIKILILIIVIGIVLYAGYKYISNKIAVRIS